MRFEVMEFIFVYVLCSGVSSCLSLCAHLEYAISLQISTLISHRERPLCSDRSLRAVARVGQAVNLAVERFVTVGETIADDNPEIKQDMYEACKEARVAGEFMRSNYLYYI